jgi:hypothetical protein
VGWIPELPVLTVGKPGDEIKPEHSLNPAEPSTGKPHSPSKPVLNRSHDEFSETPVSIESPFQNNPEIARSADSFMNNPEYGPKITIESPFKNGPEHGRSADSYMNNVPKKQNDDDDDDDERGPIKVSTSTDGKRSRHTRRPASID